MKYTILRIIGILLLTAFNALVAPAVLNFDLKFYIPYLMYCFATGLAYSMVFLKKG